VADSILELLVHGHEAGALGGQIQKELISDLMRKKRGVQREEIIGTGIEINGKCKYQNKV
jgi:hypothetical protein